MVLEALREERLLMLSNYQVLGVFRMGMQRTMLPAFEVTVYLAIFCLLTGSSIDFLQSWPITCQISIDCKTVMGRHSRYNAKTNRALSTREPNIMQTLP